MFASLVFVRSISLVIHMSNPVCRFLRSSLTILVVLVPAETPVLVQAQTPSVPPDYSHGAKAFPTVLSPYQPSPIKTPTLDNSPRLHDLIRNGHLELSLSDAMALTIENNLDIAVQRYVHPIAEADVLRASSGQAARGVAGALLPSGLSAGALGVGVNTTSGTGGVGSAGGISGGGGAVQVGQAGTFDPAVTFSSSYDRTSSPLNSLVVAGVPQVSTTSSAGSVSLTQLLPQGTSFTLTTNGIAQNSTQQSLLFNPAVVSRMALGVNQPLLSGFGSLPNKRFLMVALNNVTTSEELFRAQVTSAIVQVEDLYWDLSASREAIAAAEEARTAAQQLVKETQDRVEIGTAAGVDVASAEAAAAAAERDLIVAQTTYQLQQAQLKNLLSKASDPDLDAAEVDPIDPLPDASGQALPDLQAAIQSALTHRPELLGAEQDLKNQDITARFTRNGMLPSVSAFALYAGSGLTGDTVRTSGGLGGSLGQDFSAAFPEYAAGVSATVALRNRSAQADNLRARLEQDQLQVQLQRSRQQIALEVRQAVISLAQGAAQEQAAREAVRLAQQAADNEQQKLEVGVSTSYDVILRQRDLLTAQQAFLGAAAGYAKALVDFQRATGSTLEQNGIELGDALAGEYRSAPGRSLASSTLAPSRKQ
jgi:outer membrane protein TolC